MRPIHVYDREAMSNPPLQAGTAPATVQETGFSILFPEEKCHAEDGCALAGRDV